MEIKFWSEAIPGDRNHRYQLAEVDGLAFCKFPFSPFLSDRRNGCTIHADSMLTLIGTQTVRQWYANVYKLGAMGKPTFLKQFVSTSKVDVFTQAVEYVNSTDGLFTRHN